MRQLGEYVVTLTAAALICSILLSLMGDGAMKAIIRLFCGIFLTVTAISPLTKLEVPDLTNLFGEYSQAGTAAVAMGTDLAGKAEMMIIKDQVEAYILDKATGLGLEVQTEVTLSEEGVPESVRIWPEPTAEGKEQLSRILAEDLGIPKESQQWTG